jgi:hypothetical protein
MISFSGVLSALAQNKTTLQYLDYPQSIFDSDTCCWRLMSANDSYAEAADLMKTYLRYHRRVENRMSLHWHLGQMLAMADQYKEAKTYFKKTYNGFYTWFGGTDGRAWYYYAKGTVAFLDSDKEKFIRLLAKWPRDSLAEKNYDRMQDLLLHWELTYKEASFINQQ